MLNDPIPPKDFDDLLRDGVLLCRVINTLKPGSVAKIQKPWTKDNQRANIQAFIDAARAYGVPDDKLFSVEDLHEKTGIPNVIKTMIFLGKAVSRLSRQLVQRPIYLVINQSRAFLTPLFRHRFRHSDLRPSRMARPILGPATNGPDQGLAGGEVARRRGNCASAGRYKQIRHPEGSENRKGA